MPNAPNRDEIVASFPVNSHYSFSDGPRLRRIQVLRLHVFQKKSKSGIKTPKPEIGVCRQVWDSPNRK
jgi:hypothetical protein